MDSRRAVVLMNLGGPDSPESVKPFLRNLFRDPDIFRFPFSSVTQPLFAWWISTMRTPVVRANYALIGGKSPILRWTTRQAELLGEALRHDGRFEIFIAMRYTEPSIADAAARIRESAITDVLLLPLYPQYSLTTTGSGVNEWKRRARELDLDVDVVKPFFRNERYLDAVVERTREALQRFPAGDSPMILFSAHGLPMSVIDRGDPYETLVREMSNLLERRLGDDVECRLSYQSKVGRRAWLEPSTHATIEELGKKGVKNLLVVPVSFVSDHFETLYELEILEREAARAAGIVRYEVMPGLNDSPLFIAALRELVLEEQWHKPLS